MPTPEFDWTLEYMAEYVNLSVRALQKQYKAFAHISCMNEVIESRLEHSKVLLNALRQHTGNQFCLPLSECGAFLPPI